jgi:hypothetical protein
VVRDVALLRRGRGTRRSSLQRLLPPVDRAAAATFCNQPAGDGGPAGENLVLCKNDTTCFSFIATKLLALGINRSKMQHGHGMHTRAGHGRE